MSKSLYINNAWIKGHGPILLSRDPATNTVIWEGTTANAEDVNQAVEAAQKAFSNWASTTLENRIALIQKFKGLVQRDKEKLALLLSLDNGKPFWDAQNEINAMINKVDISIAAYASRCPETKLHSSQKQTITRHRPHGVVAVFGPFNFPAHLPNGHFIPALIAGNTIVFKPSDLTPAISEAVMRLWEEVGLPKGVQNMVQGGVETGQALANHPALNGLFFTGSWKTGQLFTEMFSKTSGKILALEMGGNNPLIVTTVDDLYAAAYITIQSAFLSAGQRCTCARRLILPEGENAEAFLKVLLKMTQKLKTAPGMDFPEPFMGPVISAAAAEKLLSVQKILRDQGGISLLEMTLLKKETGLLSPGIMDVTHIKSRQDEEYFGPFLQVIRVKNFEEALLEAKNTAYGLTAGLISNNEAEFEQFADAIKAGILCWNSPTTGVESTAPFGGTGKSGNFRPTALYAADYCAYPVTFIEAKKVQLPEILAPGISLKDPQ